MSSREPLSPKRSFLVPEVIQSSAMDCGPASLKALLEGFGIPASYGRLREACQTAVDGTSIDTLEELAIALDLEAEQVMVPVDHLLFPEAQTFPAIFVTTLPNGSTHFAVLWRRHGPFLQVMDPAVGRRWVRAAAFLNEAYVHEFSVPAADWREWAASEEFLGGLGRRLDHIGADRGSRARLIETALREESWRTIGALDAATRFVQALVDAGAVGRGREALALLENSEPDKIPRHYWSVRSHEADGDEGSELILRGALMVRVKGPLPADSRLADEQRTVPDLAATIAAPEPKPTRQLWDLLRRDGLLTPSLLLGAIVAAAAGVLLEALVFRSLLDLGDDLALSGQRLGALIGVLILGGALLLLDVPVAHGLWRLGRHVETRLRIAFLEKVPLLGDRYFGSRLSSDMAERSHSLHQVRNTGVLVGDLLSVVFELLFVAVGIAWLDPASAPWAVAAAIGAIAIPVFAFRGLAERDLRVRSHAGALSRFYLDALVGLMPIRAHTAEDAMRREHESLLSEWSRAGFRLQTQTVLMLGAQLLLGFSLAILLVISHLQRGSDSSAVLLLVYWALTLPVLGQAIALLWSRYPWQRNVTLRLLEPLGAPSEEAAEAAAAPDPAIEPLGPPAISLRGVTVVAGGHTLLQDVEAEIAAGSHVAIVGASGAGKSTLVGLLLGWHRPERGELLVDGHPLDPSALAALRLQTAWVDPSIRLWNRSLLENLTFGNEAEDLGSVVQDAMLEDVLRRLPDGMQTELGEGGGFVSGGEGQRVRLGRAMVRRNARLVILDEPFRGLDRETRNDLLHRCRRIWKDATFLYITHDLRQTLDFDRVLVIEKGRLVEHDSPRTLASNDGGAYHRLLLQEAKVRQQLWASDEWRRLEMVDGRLVERAPGELGG